MRNRQVVLEDCGIVDSSGLAEVAVDALAPPGWPAPGEILTLDFENLDMVVHGEVVALDREAGTMTVRAELAR